MPSTPPVTRRSRSRSGNAHQMHGRLFSVALATLLVLVSACSSEHTADSEWGTEANRYFEELAQRYRANDFYGVLDFYGTSAEVDKYRAFLHGGTPISDLLRWNSGDLDHDVQAIHLASQGAVTLVHWTATDQFSAIEARIHDGRITGETVFDLSESQRRSLRASPEVIASYASVYADYANQWTDRTPIGLRSLYTSDAQIEDSLLGVVAEGQREINSLEAPGLVVATTLIPIRPVGIGPAPAIYLGGSDYGVDPLRALGLFDVTDAAGCRHRMAVAWEIADGRIAHERRYHDVETFPTCTDSPARGWWADAPIPGPVDQVATSVLRTPGGQRIATFNATPRLEDLLLDGLARFTDAGLVEPAFDRVTFEPSRSCQNRTGRVIQDSESRSLFVCMYESDLCPRNQECAVPAVSRRADLLHELGHAWTIDHLDDETRQRFVALTGVEVWRDDVASWAEQGEEWAAEVLVWGLHDDPLPMVRIGDPPCETLSAAFRLLTDTEPLRSVDDC